MDKYTCGRRAQGGIWPCAVNAGRLFWQALWKGGRLQIVSAAARPPQLYAAKPTRLAGWFWPPCENRKNACQGQAESRAGKRGSPSAGTAFILIAVWPQGSNYHGKQHPAKYAGRNKGGKGSSKRRLPRIIPGFLYSLKGFKVFEFTRFPGPFISFCPAHKPPYPLENGYKAKQRKGGMVANAPKV